MFTGIVEEVGQVTAVDAGADSARVTIAGPVVVVALQVQRPMHHEVRQVVRGPPLGRPRLAPHDAQREHDVPALERQHVGRFVAPAVTRVEPAHREVGRQHDDAGAPGQPRRTGCEPGGAGHEPAP